MIVEHLPITESIVLESNPFDAGDTEIAVWPDGDWCHAEEVAEYMADLGKSDDFEYQHVDEHTLASMH